METEKKKTDFFSHFTLGHSVLGRRIFKRIFLFAFILSVFALIIACTLYIGTTFTNTGDSCYRAAETVFKNIGEQDIEMYNTSILNAYTSDPELRNADAPKDKYERYLKEAARVTSSDYNSGLYNALREYLAYYCDETDKDRAFYAIFDQEKRNLIIVADSGITGETIDAPSEYAPGEVLYDMGEFAEIPDAVENVYFTLYVYEDSLVFRGVMYYRTQGNYIYLVGSDQILDEVLFRFVRFLLAYLLMLLIITHFITIVLAWYFSARVVTPVNMLSQAAEKYTEDKQNGFTNENHFSNLRIHTKDEIQHLRDTLSDMERDVSDYYQNLLQATAEQERMASEMEIARKIQDDALPRIFPPFPEKANVFDIYATMDPAKEVGGDFYDFFLLDDHTLAFLIADVSGKGIPGALFMMQSKLLISTAAKKIGRDPAAILEEVNHSVMQNNAAEMFVTVWLAILDLTTGKMICSNAGHEYPFIQKAGGRFELLKDKHGFVIGGMDNLKFKNYDIQLAPGDAVFVYTDGAPEAVNVDEEMYGTDRISEALNQDPERRMMQLLIDVKTSIDEFTEGAEQFDDITMVGLRYYGE